MLRDIKVMLQPNKVFKDPQELSLSLLGTEERVERKGKSEREGSSCYRTLIISISVFTWLCICSQCKIVVANRKELYEVQYLLTPM